MFMLKEVTVEPPRMTRLVAPSLCHSVPDPELFSIQLSPSLATFVLAVVVACFNSMDRLFFTFFKVFQTFLFRFTVKERFI